MEKNKLARVFILVSILLSLAFIFMITRSANSSTLEMGAIASLFSALFIINLTVFAARAYADLRNLLIKIHTGQGTHETLLLDLRDGTRKFYHEKRKTIRVKKDLTAQLIGKEVREFIKTVDVSFDGAQLSSSYRFELGDTIDLNLYLPIYAQPIGVKVRVVRVTAAAVEDGKQMYNVGVKYLEMPEDNRKKLIEAIEQMMKKQERKKS
jgi:hypothetical protein